MKTRFVLFIAPFILALTITSIPTANVSAQTDAISLDHTVGRLGLSDSIACGQPIEFHLRATNNSGEQVMGMTVAFQVNSPDSALWSPIVMDTVPLGWKTMFDGLVSLYYYSVSGSDADTVCMWGGAITPIGFPVGLDTVAWIITTQVNCTEQSKTICIDSVTSASSCGWLWTTSIPTWDGPHCFTIIKCCSGLRGDLNYDGKSANTLDLSFMVDFIFRGSNDPGDCIESRDINGDGSGPNILDLTFLIDYMFRGGPPPEACP